MKSNTRIEKQIQKKKNPLLVKTLIASKKNKKWGEIASILSGPRRKRISLNLEEISKNSKDGENVLIPGKVLSQGEIDKKIKIIALNFSEKAREKLLKSGSKISTIEEEIKTNPEAKGIKILK